MVNSKPARWRARSAVQLALIVIVLGDGSGCLHRNCDNIVDGHCAEPAAVDPGMCSTIDCGETSRTCKTHTDCAASSTCLPDGSCAATDDVAYLDQEGTDSAECRLSAPCTKLSAALATGRGYIKLRGRIDDAVTISGGRRVALIGDPRTLSTGKEALAVLTHRQRRRAHHSRRPDRGQDLRRRDHRRERQPLAERGRRAER